MLPATEIGPRHSCPYKLRLNQAIANQTRTSSTSFQSNFNRGESKYHMAGFRQLFEKEKSAKFFRERLANAIIPQALHSSAESCH
ncbi:unnamed protein product [Larinioides sclopetarius]|uniref:Uncharacterized protein n=1 Tax=Larinioides sclopetarius TaxID=280406 RepID=A0AAV2AZ99_9ARAC